MFPLYCLAFGDGVVLEDSTFISGDDLTEQCCIVLRHFPPTLTHFNMRLSVQWQASQEQILSTLSAYQACVKLNEWTRGNLSRHYSVIFENKHFDQSSVGGGTNTYWSSLSFIIINQLLLVKMFHLLFYHCYCHYLCTIDSSQLLSDLFI